MRSQIVMYRTLHVAFVVYLTFVTSFCFNTLCQYTPLLNLYPLIFSLTPFGYLRFIMLTPYFLK